ncbi:class I SAM-dependent methyltransferase [Thermoleptolyngbya sichuanensis XZ-Cy5]|uniref:class I SAM-dependent methyltransferase n=1 Tax=Thermoleptolyngbya sichuanensis TaxID=2885951 RepID=UPI00240E57E8|nr:class I SAM-dependent methyltransferase [Thermoleptolyngbya sichuanensis]MDG2616678.1 class I SAM-dependent methyltransferase [Thermoleptolyngbya sichuanensis XZ-Cy5]
MEKTHSIPRRPMPYRRLLAIALACLLWFCGISPTRAQDLAPVLTLDPPPPNTEFYEYRVLHNPDGIGKFYMGREIAQVMGHQGAAWLERPGRSIQEQPDKVLPALNLKPTDVVADIGAGTGYFSFRLSSLVPQGKVLAVDIQPEMIDILEFFKQEAAEAGTPADNVEPVLGEPDNPQLAPDSIDLALMVDAYHEFEYPREMMEAIFKALKPGGRVALVEYRGENPFISIKGLHKMTQRQVKQEMQAVGLVWRETKGFLPQQHLMIFQKPA